MSDRRPLHGLRALVVEDEPFIASDLEHILSREGASLVALAGSAEEAARKLGFCAFDVGLLDINLRGEPCFGLADDLCRRRLPFAFVSGYCMRLIPLRFAAVPNWGKPYDEREIVGGIRMLWTRAGDA